MWVDLDIISADVNPAPAYSVIPSIHRPTQSLLMSLRRLNPSRSNPGPRTTLLDPENSGTLGLIYETVTDVLFGVVAGGNVNARSARFCE